jgi:hypothetical protein
MRLRSATGQTSSEYLGVMAIVSVIIAAIAVSGLAREMKTLLRGQVCKVLANCNSGKHDAGQVQQPAHYTFARTPSGGLRVATPA